MKRYIRTTSIADGVSAETIKRAASEVKRVLSTSFSISIRAADNDSYNTTVSSNSHKISFIVTQQDTYTSIVNKIKQSVYSLNI